jgi:ectoine hydroxylase-related dioxygenase (phytanoyl-CoA dioxygenase family)
MNASRSGERATSQPSPEERDAYRRDGYVLRERVFEDAALGELRSAAEDVVAQVVARARREEAGPEFRLDGGHRFQFSSHSLIQWEWREGSQQVRLLEPFSHLHPRFEALWRDPRFIEPARAFLERDAAAPFTCKLNMKRPRDGSEFPWHQDHPYWYVRTPEHAHEVLTAMLFLDDARAENGALRVLPGSHRAGPAPRDPSRADSFTADPARIDETREVMLEAPAGSLLFFPALLLHRSAPNTSEHQRRAILLSFQPPGRPRQEALPWRPELVRQLP